MKMIALLVLLLSACAAPIVRHTSANYFDQGVGCVERGDWLAARKAFGRAWINAEQGGAEVRYQAICAYEYGRASGVICDWEEAERGLLRSLELDREVSGPVHMSMVELARMFRASGRLVESEEYFAMAEATIHERGLETRDSIGFADVLRDHADVLTRLGRTEEADALTSRERAIREAFPDGTTPTDLTPYGEHCDGLEGSEGDAARAPAG